MVTKEFENAQKIRWNFNEKSLGVELYNMAVYSSKILTVGVNIASSGTQSVRDSKIMVANIMKAIQLATKINSKKITIY